jgi:SAM-dependent methyltransferase
LQNVRSEEDTVTKPVSLIELRQAGLRRVHRFAFALQRHRRRDDFRGSASYWERRYQVGSDSGAGSYGLVAAQKAGFVNEFVAVHAVQSVIEFGCGDGNQLGLARYPQYLGLDVSREAVRICQDKFAQDTTKAFKLLDDYDGERAELALSLDVIFHLVEDAVFADYMRRLFDAAERYVIVFSSNTNRRTPIDRAHVRHRRFTDWTARRTDWRALEHPQMKGLRRQAAFFVYERLR